MTMLAQIMEGELRVTVRDPDGRPVAAHVALSARNPQFRAETKANDAGLARFQRLPFGVYSLVVNQKGFQEFSSLVEISRISIFRTFPVMVMGKSTTNFQNRGIL